MKRIFCLAAIFLFAVYASPHTLIAQVKEYVVSSSAAPSDLERLAAMMEGNFASTAQSAKDTSYQDIRLHFKRIWQNRTDGVWFYGEHAVAQMQKKPYRQRIYRLQQREDSTIEMAVYTINDPLRFAGEWKKLKLLYTLPPDSLVLHGGCSIFLHKSGTDFTGSTREGKCLSDLHGATYSTSTITVTPKTFLSWEQGFSTSGKQVWGSAKGPYQFVKQK